jgi:hypothetical protein
VVLELPPLEHLYIRGVLITKHHTSSRARVSCIRFLRRPSSGAGRSLVGPGDPVGGVGPASCPASSCRLRERQGATEAADCGQVTEAAGCFRFWGLLSSAHHLPAPAVRHLVCSFPPVLRLFASTSCSCTQIRLLTAGDPNATQRPEGSSV